MTAVDLRKAEESLVDGGISPTKQEAGVDTKNNDIHIIDWDGPDDPAIPSNWSPARKWLVAGTALFGTLIVPLNGTSITLAATSIGSEFHVSDAVFPNTYWSVTSWSLGGAVSIIVLLPLMEDLGVRTGSLITYVFFLLMIIPQAFAQNFATLVVTRFFSGGCVTLLANIISSIIPDLWTGDSARSLPVSVYVLLYLVGATLAPPMFAGVMQHIGDWRWLVLDPNAHQCEGMLTSEQDLLHSAHHLWRLPTPFRPYAA